MQALRTHIVFGAGAMLCALVRLALVFITGPAVPLSLFLRRETP